MDRLRPRNRKVFTGFTTAEIEKMEKLLKESGERETTMEVALYKKLTLRFNTSRGRAGNPILKWTEVQSWFQKRQLDSQSKDNPVDSSNKLNPKACPFDKGNESSPISKGEKVPALSELEFEARSSKDGAWYDVDKFLNHRFLSSGEAEVRVRYIGFGSDQDEWVNVKNSVRERSLALEHSECRKVKVGDLVLCFQERKDQARYYDGHVVEIQRKLHDIRGCRCLFLIRYDHDNTKERVQLNRLCCRPTY